MASLTSNSMGSVEGTSSTASIRPELEETLVAGQRAMRRIRCRLSSVMMLLGLSFGTAGGLCYSWKDSPSTSPQLGISRILQCIGLVLIHLAPVRGDVHLTTWVVVASTCLLGVDFAWHLWWGDIHNSFTEAYLTVDGVFVLSSIVAACVGVDDLQQLLWRMLFVFFVAQTAIDIFQMIDPWLEFEQTPLGRAGASRPFSAYLVGDLFGVVCTALSRFRFALHGRLNRMFGRRGAEATAASISALMGDCCVQEVVAQAAQRFRCILLSDLCEGDLATSSPKPELHDRTRRVRFGECDAFISHSWSDDGEAKWMALQGWCARFREERGREPKLWLDKCCIDQTDVETSLRCLPLFLSGCKGLVVF